MAVSENARSAMPQETPESAERPCRLAFDIDGGPSLTETQTARSDADWTYTYAMPEGPLPLKNYESTIRLAYKRT